MLFTKEDLEGAFVRGMIEGGMMLTFNTNTDLIEAALINNIEIVNESFNDWFYNRFVSELKDK